MIYENIEIVPTSIYNFFTTIFVNTHVNKEFHIKKEKTPLWLNDLIYKRIHNTVKKFDHALQDFPYYEPFSDIFNDMANAQKIVSPGANFGEGWLIPAEICNMANNGIENIISLQPFACIANHIISKGIEKRVKQIYPKINLLFLDFDASTSDVNIYNRILFMLHNAKKNLEN